MAVYPEKILTWVCKEKKSYKIEPTILFTLFTFKHRRNKIILTYTLEAYV